MDVLRWVAALRKIRFGANGGFHGSFGRVEMTVCGHREVFSQKKSDLMDRPKKYFPKWVSS